MMIAHIPCWAMSGVSQENNSLMSPQRIKQMPPSKNIDGCENPRYTKDITKKELKKTCRLSTPYEAHKEMKLPNWEEFAA